VSVLNNIDNDAVSVYWSRLIPVRADSFRRECPFCDGGVLLIGRTQKAPYGLLERDRCIQCGQLVRWLDIEVMRGGSKDGDVA
jgi:hypothetical protein